MEKQIPQELEKKLECAALHLFRRWTFNRLAEEGGYFTDVSNIWRWVREVFQLLDLPQPGHGGTRSQKLRKCDP